MPYKDKEKQQKFRADSYARSVLAYQQYKESKPCFDCQKHYPHYVMEFDHVRGKKKHNVGNLVNQWDSRICKEEVDKCDLICSNCHSARTWFRSRKNIALLVK